MAKMKIHTGSCLCKGVMFEVMAPLNNVDTCHCTQCRKTSGHIGASIIVPSAQMEILRFETLKWFKSMDAVSKGFCNDCGSTLFWNFQGRDGWSVSAGAFDKPTGVKINCHYFTSEKGDYYDISDGRPQAELFDVDFSRIKRTMDQGPTKSKNTNNER
jgi:hypothetical protein